MLFHGFFVALISEQLPCRSAEVKIFSVFLCQRCREVWGEILVKFSVLRFPGFGVCDGKFHQNFTSKTARKTENFTQHSLCWGAALTHLCEFYAYSPWKSLLESETGGILFREYCFGEKNSLKLGEFCEELGEFAFTQIIG